MTKKLLPLLLLAGLFHSCLPSPSVVTRRELLSNLRVCDNSYVGLLGMLHLEGRVENRNRFTVDRIELQATIYNSKTREKSSRCIKLCVPITCNGSATYCEKIYVGSGLSQNVQCVVITNGERY